MYGINKISAEATNTFSSMVVERFIFELFKFVKIIFYMIKSENAGMSN